MTPGSSDEARPTLSVAGAQGQGRALLVGTQGPSGALLAPGPAVGPSCSTSWSLVLPLWTWGQGLRSLDPSGQREVFPSSPPFCLSLHTGSLRLRARRSCGAPAPPAPAGSRGSAWRAGGAALQQEQ